MAESKSCVVAGHICLDVIPDLSNAGEFATTFLPGRLLEAGPVMMSTGGTVSNTGQALHNLGIPTRLMGKVGDDMFGQTIRDLLENVDGHLITGMQVVPGEASSYTIILSPPNTDRIFFHSPGTNDTFAAADVDYAALQEVDLFHFGYPQVMKQMYEQDGAALASIFKQAKATGVTTSLDTTMPDPNSPAGQADWRQIFQTVLPYVDIFTPSVEEILFMLQPDIFAELSEKAVVAGTEVIEFVRPEHLLAISNEVLALGCKIVLLKANYRGLYLRTTGVDRLKEIGRACPTQWFEAWAHRELWSPVFQVKVVGTTGAGDSAIAGLLAALLRDLAPVEALTMANAVGACNVEASDAVSGIRSWSDTLARIEAGWPHQEMTIASSGWHFDKVTQIWVGPNDQRRMTI